MFLVVTSYRPRMRLQVDELFNRDQTLLNIYMYEADDRGSASDA